MATSNTIRTLADLQVRLGGVAWDRIRFYPHPGTATVQDVIEIERREGKLCELVEGVLLEKTVGFTESRLALLLGGLLNAFVIARNLGIVSGSDGTMEILADLVRIPDIAFTSWDRFPGRRRPDSPVPLVAPNLAVEILTRGNTPGEMTVKRQDYFDARVQVVWEVDPRKRTVAVFTSPSDSVLLHPCDTLDGGQALPGFTLPLQELFAELDRQG